MPGTNEKNLLQSAVDTLEREYHQLRMLINSGKNGPFTIYQESKEDESIITFLKEVVADSSLSIQNTFGEPLAIIENEIRMVKRAWGLIDEEAVGEFGDEPPVESVSQAWVRYHKLKNQTIPNLTSEILAVLGGIHLRRVKHDNAWANIDIERVLSFSNLANQLVQDIMNRSVSTSYSVLIVGEERFTKSQANVIRLRFPACDLWHLPFAVHEYGYLVATSGEAPNELNKQKSTINTLFDPGAAVNIEKFRSCYLPEVKLRLKEYRNLSDSEQKKYRQRNEAILDQLVKRQLTHLNRLFADAFATYFLGPAYVHALLHLKFTPDRNLFVPSEELPSFAQRYFIAFETLKWMNDYPIKGNDYQRLFNQEVFKGKDFSKRDGGFPQLWAALLKSAGKEKHELTPLQDGEEGEITYETIAKDLDPWLKVFQQIFLSPNYRKDTAIKKTFERWNLANAWFTAGYLTDPNLGQGGGIKVSRPDLEENMVSTILNAAWKARYFPAKDKTVVTKEDVETIEANALKLIMGEIPIRPDDISDAGGERGPGGLRPLPSIEENEALDTLGFFLYRNDRGLHKKFEALKESNKLHRVPAELGKQIEEMIQNEEAIKQAYRTLFK